MKTKIEIICDYLLENGISDYEIINHDAVKTMADVFQVIQAQPSQMIKAVLLQANGKYILLGIPANKLVDFKCIATQLGISKNKIKFASADDVRNVMNYEPGALPPFSLNHQEVPFIIDSSFTQHEYVFCGAGTHFHTLKIKTDELKKLPGFKEGIYYLSIH